MWLGQTWSLTFYCILLETWWNLITPTFLLLYIVNTNGCETCVHCSNFLSTCMFESFGFSIIVYDFSHCCFVLISISTRTWWLRLLEFCNFGLIGFPYLEFSSNSCLQVAWVSITHQHLLLLFSGCCDAGNTLSLEFCNVLSTVGTLYPCCCDHV